MSLRSAWKGTLQLSLMAIPIKLYKATDTVTRFPFKMLHSGDCGGQVGSKSYCKVCQTDLASDQITKGFEWQKGSFVEITKDDVESVKLSSTGSIEIRAFVDPEDIGLAFYDEAYYAGTDVGGEKAFAILRETLDQAGKVAIGRVVIRGREDFLAIRPEGSTLLVQLLRYKHEVRAVGSIPTGNVIKAAPAEIELATQLVDSMTVPFSEIETPDRYAEAMREMIERKRLGQKIEPKADGPRAPVVDILSALKQSIKAQDEKKKAAKKKTVVVSDKKKKAA